MTREEYFEKLEVYKAKRLKEYRDTKNKLIAGIAPDNSIISQHYDFYKYQSHQIDLTIGGDLEVVSGELREAELKMEEIDAKLLCFNVKSEVNGTGYDDEIEELYVYINWQELKEEHEINFGFNSKIISEALRDRLGRCPYVLPSSIDNFVNGSITWEEFVASVS